MVHVRVCRDCGEEYRPEAVRCADCGGELEDRREGDESVRTHPPEPGPASADLPGHRVLFLTPRAADLVPMAERLRDAQVEYRLGEQRGIGEGTPSRFALLVPEETVSAALRALTDLIAPHEGAGRVDAVETGFSPEGGYAQCPACGAQPPPGAVECPECGLGLGAGEDETAEAQD